MNHLLRAGKKEQNGYARYCHIYYLENTCKTSFVQSQEFFVNFKYLQKNGCLFCINLSWSNTSHDQNYKKKNKWDILQILFF